MRPWLRWSLVLSVLSSALAIWWPDDVSRAVSRTEAAVAGSQAAIDRAVDPAAATTGNQPPITLAQHLPAVTLEQADFDPFVGVQPPLPPPPKPILAPVVAPPPPLAPTAPPLAYRYLGQMVDPSGKRFVYLGKADQEVPVAVGTQLDEGYVVEAIAADGIQLRYPPLDVRAVINIPPASDTSTP